jgi:predicted AlkP superfamily pyrophosphatase or phosphodiesterase
MKMKLTLIALLNLVFFGQVNGTEVEKKYKTENVFIIVMDGPRYSETWGDSTHKLIPHMANDLASYGVIYEGFRANGPTYTNSGHTALTTGVYQQISNVGTEYPKYPSIFQYWLKATGKPRTAAYVISSKDKLSILTDCKNKKWKGQYRPYSDCGINGLETGYRMDDVTYNRSVEIAKTDKPNLVLINFRLVDSWGHAGNWENYLSSITLIDSYIYNFFRFLQTEENYKDKTTIFVTNDHGRHLDGVKDGFISHGDNCEGCRRINCFAYGPDFKKGVIMNTPRELVDIPATIAELLGFTMERCDGQVMTELFLNQ